MNIRAYTAWSLLDKFEWDEGYSERFGLYYVDFRDKNKPRYPKASVQYYKSIISSNGFPNQREVKSLYGSSQFRVKQKIIIIIIVTIVFDVLTCITFHSWRIGRGKQLRLAALVTSFWLQVSPIHPTLV